MTGKQKKLLRAVQRAPVFIGGFRDNARVSRALELQGLIESRAGESHGDLEFWHLTEAGERALAASSEPSKKRATPLAVTGEFDAGSFLVEAPHDTFEEAVASAVASAMGECDAALVALRLVYLPDRITRAPRPGDRLGVFHENFACYAVAPREET